MKNCFCVLLSFCLLAACAQAPRTADRNEPNPFAKIKVQAPPPKNYQRVLVRCLNPADKKKGHLLEAQVVENLKTKGRVFAVSQHEAFSTKRNVSILEALKFASNQRLAAVLTVTPNHDAYDLRLTDVNTNGSSWVGEVAMTQKSAESKEAANLIAAKLINSRVVAPTAITFPLPQKRAQYRRK